MHISQYLREGFFICLFAWISFFPAPVQGRYLVISRVFLGVVLLILMLRKKYADSIVNFEDWPLWLFLICLLAGIVSSVDRNLAVETYFYLATTFLLFFYAGKWLYGPEKDVYRLNLAICICAALVALIGLTELYFGRNFLYEKLMYNPYYNRYVRSTPRPMSTQFNPAVLGSYLLGSLPSGLYFLKDKSIRLRLLGIFLSLLYVIVIVLTLSRGVFLGLIALTLFYLWHSPKRKRNIVIFSFCLISAICVSSFSKNFNYNRFGFKRFIAGSYDSIISKYRMDRICMTAKILRDYPLFGIGFNHFRLRFDEYADKKNLNEISEFRIPDNMYLTLLAESGVVGFSGFFIFIFLLFKRGIARLKSEKEESRKLVLLVSMSALVGLLVNMGAYELFYWSNPYMFFCLLCGFICGLMKNEKHFVDSPPRGYKLVNEY